MYVGKIRTETNIQFLGMPLQNQDSYVEHCLFCNKKSIPYTKHCLLNW